MSLANSGQEPHHAQLIRLNDGVTLPQFQEALLAAGQANFEGPAVGQLFAMVTFQGGPGTTPPGKSTGVVLNLQQGQYVMACFVADAQGGPHVAKGRIKPLTVSAPPQEQAAEPETDQTITLQDFSFALPSALQKEVEAKDVRTVRVVNRGTETHKMGIVRLTGVTLEQFRQIVTAPPGGEAPSGPPPFEDAGGFQAIGPNGTGWAELNLTRGDYALFCFIPSPANQGAPHVALGMIASLKVK
ncbi:MAG: hypothetical protein EXR48_07325 [Dehalococcoidia bacterium]|nr:hypothetical protein [Dehalococcoidia bacterium]